MPEVPADVRAVQWNERGDDTGHIELLDCTNLSITANDFATYSALVARAQTKIDSEIPPVITDISTADKTDEDHATDTSS